MYLHQQLVDNLVLMTCTKNVNRLQSSYTYSIIVVKRLTDEHYFYFNTRPNTIRKLKYQSSYNVNELMISNQWNYISGPIYLDKYNMMIAMYIDDYNKINYYIDNGIILDEDILEYATNYGYMELVEICLESEVIPTYTAYINALESGDELIIDMIKIYLPF